MKRLFFLLVAGLATVWLGVSSGAPSPSPCPVLLVIDCSLDMAPLKPALRDLVWDLVLSGFDGRLESGECFGLWPFQDQPGRLLAQDWEAGSSPQLAGAAVRFLQALPFQHRSKLDPVMAELNAMLRHLPDITVVLISDGNQRLSGTPFDRQINAIYRNRRRELRRLKVPFVTVLAGENGHWTGWTLHAGAAPVTEITALPSRKKPAVAIEVPKPRLAPGQTGQNPVFANSTNSTSQPTTAAPAGKAATNAPAEKVLAASERVEEKQDDGLTRVPGPPIPRITNEPLGPPKRIAAVTLEKPVVPSGRPMGAVWTSAPPARAAEKPQPAPSLAPKAPAPQTNLAKRALEPAHPRSGPAAPAAEPASHSRGHWLIAGLVLLALVYFIHGRLRRRRTAQPSFISKSYDPGYRPPEGQARAPAAGWASRRSGD